MIEAGPERKGIKSFKYQMLFHDKSSHLRYIYNI